MPTSLTTDNKPTFRRELGDGLALRYPLKIERHVMTYEGYDYPTDEVLNKVKEWPHTDYLGLMEFIKANWWMPDWGWEENDNKDEIFDEPIRVYNISTGGWSGNENLIDAMQENKNFFWIFCWVQSRRGGHYIFHVKKGQTRERRA